MIGRLGYLRTQLAVDAEGVAVDDLDLFRTHFVRRPAPAPALAGRPPDATLVLRRAARQRVPPGAARVVIRPGRTEHVAVRARRLGPHGLLCEASGTRLTFDVARRLVRFDVPGQRPGRELIEVVRSLVLRNEENHGVVVAGAAVVELDGRAVVFAGVATAGAAPDLVLRHGAGW